MVNMIGKVFALAVILGIGFGIHSLLGYVKIYQLHWKDIAASIYFLNLGAVALISVVGMPQPLAEDRRTEDDE